MPRLLSSELQVLEVDASQNRSINCAQNMRNEHFRWFRSTYVVVSGTPNCFSIILFKSEPIWSKSYVDFHHFVSFRCLRICEAISCYKEVCSAAFLLIFVKLISKVVFDRNFTSQEQ